MTIEQAQEILDELNEVRPELLNDEAKILFEAIMKIANERDKIKQEYDRDTHILQNRLDLANAKNFEKDKIINSMAEYISEHADCPCENEGKDLDCEKMCDVRIDRDCWKIYFENKVKEFKCKDES